MTRYEAVYGQIPPSPVPYLPSCSKVGEFDQLLQNHAAMIAHLKDNQHQVQNIMNKQADKHRF